MDADMHDAPGGLPPHATVADLAGYFKVSTRTIRRWIVGGRLRALRTSAIHGRLRISRAAVHSFETANEVQ